MEKKIKKVFNDPIHGNIELHPLCVTIVNTPQFQRLRFIKQLGGAYFVYPGAAHNRFEHSIGVCHLAGRLVRALKEKKSDALKGVDITDEDILCVEVAGLCHDLGHGPFSHLFDQRIIPALRTDKKWKHENGSVDMFRYMLKANDLEKKFDEEDRTFIEELIDGPGETYPKGEKNKKRREQKGFLYEIVSNKRNGIDVDKWDYFARDCHMLGIQNNFNHDRCIDFSRVIEVNGERQICYRDKEAANLYDMFHTRYLLHIRAYQHKTNNIIEYMIAEALILADEFIRFPGQKRKAEDPISANHSITVPEQKRKAEDPISANHSITVPEQKREPCEMCEAREQRKMSKAREQYKMSEAIDDMMAYSLLNDCVIYTILGSTDSRLEKSKEILLRVLRRDLYKFVGEERFAHNTFKNESDVKEKMENVTEDGKTVVDLVNFNYGKKHLNPIDFVNFYSKEKPDEAEPKHKENVSLLLPKNFAEQLVRVYCKDPNSYEEMKIWFNDWSEKHRDVLACDKSTQTTQ
ncbi:deoxynucleoside triphosphate triphosphohydrolase SAMHD1-like isoform X11 [Mercenaria mercenaria]|uniref:deoxynucleoside triphosphate triphosphohydrolase SAMHD1-like isoform X9 n=1 Tax=Mercenaria mercenaria TaxID=6596 RepID=UPI00234E9C79|nr:deoxynucleoside triphosphate triphosphohydrolase SAMHD1-like isoform X9 [Mercenaria mercenaria]XP_053387691.1 deoxynucleoside triphosphate triphosphohydrolase SAMHD1-like isoform X10 [Mercenaria mercenaria]XP_053387692.1 deoxynucleoside triphosphate triphosphohydrolase SAMHD1-like isoform X11 [Mercenaria mercenaria]